MSEEALSRRLPLYAYLEPLLAGRRVLEVGKPREGSAEFLVSLGATRVVSSEADTSGVKDQFDVVLVPEADALVLRPGVLAALQKLLADKGRLVVAVANPERAGGGGIGYYELHDAVRQQFPRVQMLGITPFLGVGLVEFDGTVDGLRVDARMVKEGAEPPAVYVAVAGAESFSSLGYALVQLPWSNARALARGQAVEPPAREVGGTGELRRQLDEASAQAESAMRVARAQGDEIEELRGRLRRAAEDRAALDAEIAKLRRGLAEADESVMTLTRRTAEEMAAVTERLAAGLRGPSEAETRSASAELSAAREEAERLRVRLAETEARAAAAEQRLEAVGGTARERSVALEDALERLRLADSELGRARRAAAKLETEARAAIVDARVVDERDRALAARDERIAKLEAEKQDLIWRLAELEDKLRTAIARAVRTEGGRAGSAAGAEARPGAVGPFAEARSAGAGSLLEARPVAGRSEEDLAAARDARERALAGFHRAAAAHVGELTEVKASVAEQAALVAELEDALAAAEVRAAGAVAEASGLRQTAKDLAEADRSRRSRLAELEGKLLRFEHERRSAVAGGASAEQDGRLRELEAEGDQLRRRADDERAAWSRERDELRAELTALAEQARAAAGRNGHDVGAAVGRELEALEAELRGEAARLAAVAHASADGGDVEPAAAASPAGETASRLEATLGNYRQRAGRLRDDLESIRRRLDALSSSEIAGFLEELGEDLAELEK